MDNYTTMELADLHLTYGEALCNGRTAQRLYIQKFPNRRHPSNKIFARIDHRLRETGSLLPCLRHNCRNRTVRTQMFEEDILHLIAEQPSTSIRSIAHAVNGSRNTVWQIMREQHLHPFRRQKVHDVSETDFEPRVNFCNWYIQRSDEDNTFPQSVLFSNESCFTREGLFNSHNNHVWSDDNPHAKFLRSYQNRFSLNVWGGIVGESLLGPHFLPPRLNGDRYLQFLEEALPELLEDLPLALRQRMWYQHDGAPAHFTANVRNYLDRHFPARWIGRGGYVAWPARSPDLTPLDFFLWGHVKTIVYETPVDTVQELRERIVAAFERVQATPGIFERVRRSMLQRCNVCIEVGGHQFEHLI